MEDKKKLALEEYEDWNRLFAFEHNDENGTFFGNGIHLYNKQTGAWRGPRTLAKVYGGLNVDLFVAGWEYAKGGEGDAVAENILNNGTAGEEGEDE